MSESPHKRARLDSPPRGAAEAASSSDDDAPAPAPALAPAASPPLAAVEQAPADAEAAEQAGEGAPAASGGDDGSGGEDDGSSSSDEDALPAGGPTTWEWNDSLGDAADVAHIVRGARSGAGSTRGEWLALTPRVSLLSARACAGRGASRVRGAHGGAHLARQRQEARHAGA
jgi:hypothetical protein